MNILIYNFKGGAAKSTTASILASWLKGAELIEIDQINKSDSRIDSKQYYLSTQLTFVNETSNSFLEFEDKIIDDSKINIIDVGAVMLDRFHTAMVTAGLYSDIDLIIVPAMDGADDFNVAIKFFENIKNLISSEKILIGFNRFDPIEYDGDVAEQFDMFFQNQKVLKKEYEIDLGNENNYFVIKNSKAIKKARAQGITLKSLVDEDLSVIKKMQREEKDKTKRLEITKKRMLVNNAQNLYKDYISVMLSKIAKKLEQK